MDFEAPASPDQRPVHAAARFPLPTKPPPWEYLIAGDLLLSELSSGIFVAAALGDLVAQNVYGEAARIGYLLAFPIIVVDLICLVLDLGQPIRFHHMLRVCKFSSPMSTGMWVLGFYSFVSFICFIFAAVDLPILHEPRAIAGGVGLAAAFFVGGYKGVMLSATAQPVWKDSRSAPFISRSAARLIGERRALAFGILAMTAAGAWIAPIVLTFMGGLWMLVASACLIIIGAAAFRHDLVMLPHKVV